MTFKWVIKAKEKGAVVMHVDPKFSRTSARSTFHVPIRSGTDIAFLGGMVKYILEKKKYFEQYVMEYTNAAFIVGEKFAFNDGIFSDTTPRAKNTTSPPGPSRRTSRACPSGTPPSSTRAASTTCSKSTTTVTIQRPYLP